MKVETYSCLCFLLCTFQCVKPDSKLILTPYIDSGDIDTARNKCKVEPDFGNVTSYSGYFTVNETCDNNLFFWFFPATKDWLSAPVIVWLQGGPGASSMFGLFEVMGPWNSFPEGLQARNYSWTNLTNVIFIDNPVGAGYSYTTYGCYPTTIEEIVDQLYSALVQFFKLFHELQGNKFFLTGESFAGHYLPPLALVIHEYNANCSAEVNISLAGMICGNPLTKLDCHDYATFLYQLGFAGEGLRDELYYYQCLLKKNVVTKNYSAAFKNWDYILNDLINNQTQMPSRNKIACLQDDLSNYITLCNLSSTKDQIHVGNETVYNDVNFVNTYNNLQSTIPEPFDWAVEKLLQIGGYIVAFYSGQLDFICLYTSTVCLMRGLQWPGRDRYLVADRSIWYIDDTVVGWTRNVSYNNTWLLDILVRDAEHSAPRSKPEATYRMMESILTASKGQNPLWKFKTDD